MKLTDEEGAQVTAAWNEISRPRPNIGESAPPEPVIIELLIESLRRLGYHTENFREAERRSNNARQRAAEDLAQALRGLRWCAARHPDDAPMTVVVQSLLDRPDVF